MRKTIFISLTIFCVTFFCNLSAQNSIQLSEIELVNLGDGQLYGYKRDDAKTPLEGKIRIITGFTTEYIDAQFAENGLAIGKWEYYKKNNLSVYSSYENGYQHGEYAELKTDGSPKVKGNYLKGKKDGKWETYSSEGDIKQLEVFKDDKVEKRVTYYTNGNVDMERNFKDGKEHGVSKTFRLDGTLKSEKSYVNGKQIGRQMQYFTSNHDDFIEISNYNDKGKRDGEFTETYAENKKLKTKGQYVNGQKDGKWKYYSLGGTLTREEVYENGVQKSSTKF